MKNTIMLLMLFSVLIAAPAGATMVLRFEPPTPHGPASWSAPSWSSYVRR